MNKKKINRVYNFFNKTVQNYTGSDLSKYVALILISSMLGLIAGSGAISFHYLLHKMKDFFEPGDFSKNFNLNKNLIFFVPILGGVIVATIATVFKNFAKEKGVVAVIKSVLINNGYVSFRVTLFHSIASLLSIGTGAPLGPEGPVAKIGSGFGSKMSQILKLSKNDMKMYTAAGAGAAIAAVFNAPIAGVFFGVEVILLNNIKNTSLSALIISSVVADVLSRAVIGTEHLFHIPLYTIGTIKDFPFYLLLGVFSGVVSLFYFGVKKWINWLLKSKFKIENRFILLIPVTIIFGVVILQYYQLFGIGYGTINDVLNNKFSINVLLILLVLKIIFLALFLEAGSFGGTFAPSVSIGAMVGFSFALIINYFFHLHLDPIVFSLAAMGGILAGINSIPLTAIMLVFEITNDYKFILPLMLVSIISYIVTIYYNKGTVYVNHLLEDGIDVRNIGEIDFLSRINVEQLMNDDFIKVNYKMPFKILLKIIANSKNGDLFVVNDKDELMGIITLNYIRNVIVDNDLKDLFIAHDLMVHAPTVIPDQFASEVVKKIESSDIDSVAVLSNANSKNIIGVITYQDIMHSYEQMRVEWETSQFITTYSQK